MPTPSYIPGMNESMLRFPAIQTQSIAALADLGAQMVRIDVPLQVSNSWNGVAPTTPTSYRAAAATEIKALNAACLAAGVQPMYVITGTIAASSSNGGVAYSPADFASACAWLAGQVPGMTWEINNEPDFSGPTATLYTTTVQTTYPAMKAADSTCTVVAGVLSNIVAYSRTYWAACYTAGIAGHYDAISVHPYNRNVGYQQNFDPWLHGNYAYGTNFTSFKALMASNGDVSTPLWVTEFGWNTGQPDTASVTFTQQAAFWTRALVGFQNYGIAVVLGYVLESGGGTQDYGLMTNFVPAPVYYAVRQLWQPSTPLFSTPTAHYRTSV